MTETQKQKAIQERKLITELANKYVVAIKEFNSRSFRLNKFSKVIDVYTKSLKCFWHDIHEYGQIQNIESFIKFEYGSK